MIRKKINRSIMQEIVSSVDNTETKIQAAFWLDDGLLIVKGQYNLYRAINTIRGCSKNNGIHLNQ